MSRSFIRETLGRRVSVALLSATLAAVFVVGCQSQSDSLSPELQQLKDEFWLDRSPSSQPLTPTDIKIAEVGDDVPDPPMEMPIGLPDVSVSVSDTGETDEELSEQPTSTQPEMSTQTEIVSDTDSQPHSEVEEGTSEEVVVAGKIDGGDLEPFQEGEATFVLKQLPDPDHASDDPEHADNCPFCKRKLKNAPVTIVHFFGKNGKPVPVSADKLFGLSKGDVVEVRGVAEYDEATKAVTINASGVYRRP